MVKVITIVVSVVFVILALMFGLPQYKVWQQGLAGEANLKRAEQEKQIEIEEARAKLESAGYLNKAEILRAQGTAKANHILGASLKGNVEYLQYLWVQGITEDDGNKPSIIYIPTEAGLPVLEAGKRE